MEEEWGFREQISFESQYESLWNQMTRGVSLSFTITKACNGKVISSYHNTKLIKQWKQIYIYVYDFITRIIGISAIIKSIPYKK